MSERGKAAFSVLAAMTIATSLWSLVPAQGLKGGGGCCLPVNGTCFESDMYACLGQNNSSANFSPGEVCADNSSCRPALEGCCEQPGPFCSDTDELGCMGSFNSTFHENAVCSGALGNMTTSGGMQPYFVSGSCVTLTPTPTQTATPTQTPIPDGASCIDPVDCMSGNCIDDVCCDTTCDGPLEACNLSGVEGVCSPTTAEAPATSRSGLISVVVMLIAVGLFSLIRRRTA